MSQHWRCALLDPPWTERGGGKIKRGADRHYPLVPTKELPGVIVRSELWLPERDAHCWMWSTNNYLSDALWLLEQLGFRYVTNAVWVKPHFGLGQYLRGQHELLLFAVRGKGQSDRVWVGNRNVSSVLHAPKTRHSQKPAESYELIERVSQGPRIEFFARSGRDGWTSWGNEAPDL